MLHAHGLSFEAAMEKLHVKDCQGNWQIGVFGFAELWSHLAGYRWLALATRRLKLLPIIDPVYNRFARWRAGSLSQCTADSCIARTPGGDEKEPI